MSVPEKPQDAFSLKKAFSELTRLRAKVSSTFGEIEEVKKRLTDLGKDVRELKDTFGTNDSWGALAKKLIDSEKEVFITTVQGVTLVGVILWVDRYNIGFRVHQDPSDCVAIGEGMLLKGGIISIFPVKE